MDVDLKSKLRWVYSSESSDDLRQKYDSWASEYDKHQLHERTGWIAPHKIVEYLKKYIAKDCWILDAGAGTGLAGEVLNKEGYKNLTGIDLSNKMMAEAIKKDVYKNYYLMDLTKKLNFGNNTFDAVIIVGVFACGHVGAEVLMNLIPIVKKEGYIVFTVREDFYESSNFKEKIGVYVKKNQITLIEKSEVYQAFKNHAILHHIEVYSIK